MSVITALRWVLLPVVCIAAWYAALILGIILMGFAEALCPVGDAWAHAVSTGVFCVSAALSAVFVVAAAFFMAPTQRVVVAWLALAIGSGVAFMMVISMPRGDRQTWSMFASAVGGGLFAVWILVRSRFALARAAAAMPVDRRMAGVRVSDKSGAFSFSLRTLLAGVIVASLACAFLLWLSLWPSVTISDKIATQEVFQLATNQPYHLEVKVVGRIDGRAKLITHSGRVTFLGPGDVNVSIAGDYYEKSATIEYASIDATSGHLRVYYKLRVML